MDIVVQHEGTGAVDSEDEREEHNFSEEENHPPTPVT